MSFSFARDGGGAVVGHVLLSYGINRSDASCAQADPPGRDWPSSIEAGCADSPSRKCAAMIPLALGCAAVFPGPRGSHLMSRMIDVFAGGMLPAGLRRPGSAALACAALIGLGTSVWFGYGYVHYQRIAVGEDAAMRRVESANADLQGALDRLRDDTQRRLQQLNADNDLLRVRVSELEQELSLPKSRRPRPSPKTAAVRRTTPASASVTAASGQTHPLAVPVSATPTGSKNFSAPGWVPNYFSDESATFVGSSTQRPINANTANHNRPQRPHSGAARS